MKQAILAAALFLSVNSTMGSEDVYTDQLVAHCECSYELLRNGVPESLKTCTSSTMESACACASSSCEREVEYHRNINYSCRHSSYDSRCFQ